MEVDVMVFLMLVVYRQCAFIFLFFYLYFFFFLNFGSEIFLYLVPQPQLLSNQSKSLILVFNGAQGSMFALLDGIASSGQDLVFQNFFFVAVNIIVSGEVLWRFNADSPDESTREGLETQFCNSMYSCHVHVLLYACLISFQQIDLKDICH